MLTFVSRNEVYVKQFKVSNGSILRSCFISVKQGNIYTPATLTTAGGLDRKQRSVFDNIPYDIFK